MCERQTLDPIKDAGLEPAECMEYHVVIRHIDTLQREEPAERRRLRRDSDASLGDVRT